MNRILKYLLASIIVWNGVLYAEFPYAPDFSLSSHVLQEPPALPQVYGVILPNAWEYYASEPTEQNILLPTAPVVMEICAIVDTIVYFYPTKETLMQGCYRGDKGLLHLVLQPYQYLPSLTTLQSVRLMPHNAHTYIYPKIVIYYKSTEQAQNFLTSIELGDFADEHGVLVINGQTFQYNHDVMLAFHELINEISDSMYLPETNHTMQNYIAYPPTYKH